MEQIHSSLFRFTKNSISNLDEQNDDGNQSTVDPKDTMNLALERLDCLDGAEVSASRFKIGRSPVQISPKTKFSSMIKLSVKPTGK